MNVRLNTFAAGIALAATLVSSQAAPTRITTLDLSKFPSFGDGNVQTGITDAITSWNASHNPDLPTYGIGATPDVKLNQGDSVSGFPSFAANTLSITLPMGDYNYVFLHWGGPDADADYLNPELYYVGDETSSVTFNAPVHHVPAVYFTSGPKNGQIKTPAQDKQYGLSFYSFYSFQPVVPVPPSSPGTSVPDTASNALLLGIGFAGLVGGRRLITRR